LTCEPTNNVNCYHGSSSFFSRHIASQTMSRFLLVVLALFAVSDSYVVVNLFSHQYAHILCSLSFDDSTTGCRRSSCLCSS